MDKVRAWKPFLKSTKLRGLASHSFLHKESRDQKSYFDHLNSMDIMKVGYEVYAEGTTRVLRICEFLDSHKRDRLSQLCAKIQVRVFHFAIHFLEHEKKVSYLNLPSKGCLSLYVIFPSSDKSETRLKILLYLFDDSVTQ